MTDTLLYTIGNTLYLNLTNDCPCSCVFCVRSKTDSMGSADSLWLEKEPTVDEFIAQLAQENLGKYDEIVFCGYGEPLTRLYDVIKICQWLRAHTDTKLRINTNGLADLVNDCNTPPLLAGLVDEVSISLNAADSIAYDEMCHPKYGEAAYVALLRFAAQCRGIVPSVVLTVVKDVISDAEVEECRKIAEVMNVHFRVRTFL